MLHRYQSRWAPRLYRASTGKMPAASLARSLSLSLSLPPSLPRVSTVFKPINSPPTSIVWTFRVNVLVLCLGLRIASETRGRGGVKKMSPEAEPQLWNLAYLAPSSLSPPSGVCGTRHECPLIPQSLLLAQSAPVVLKPSCRVASPWTPLKNRHVPGTPRPEELGWVPASVFVNGPPVILTCSRASGPVV